MRWLPASSISTKRGEDYSRCPAFHSVVAEYVTSGRARQVDRSQLEHATSIENVDMPRPAPAAHCCQLLVARITSVHGTSVVTVAFFRSWPHFLTGGAYMQECAGVLTVVMGMKMFSLPFSSSDVPAMRRAIHAVVEISSRCRGAPSKVSSALPEFAW